MTLPHLYHAMKQLLENSSGLSQGLLHVHAGMLVYLFATLLQTERRGSMAPVLLVIAASVGNELIDRAFFGSWRWADTVRDVVNTAFWPLAISAVTIYRRRLWGAERRSLGRSSARPCPNLMKSPLLRSSRAKSRHSFERSREASIRSAQSLDSLGTNGTRVASI